MFLGKGTLKICNKFTGEHPCRSLISIKLLCIFSEYLFPKNTLNGCFYIYRRFLYSISIFKIIKLLVGKKILVGPFCTSHSICYNIRFRQDSFVWTCCAFNHSTFNYKTLVQFYEINIGFSESLIIENVQNLN